MFNDIKLVGKQVSLASFNVHNVTKQYVDWLNEDSINKFLESRHQIHSLVSCQEYIEKINASNDSQIFRIIDNETNLHVGNIKIGPINQVHGTAPIGLFIGIRSLQGKGYATEAIGLICEYSFQELGLHKLIAGADSENLGSIKAFEKNGFQREGLLLEQTKKSNNQRGSTVLLGRIKG